MPFYNIKISGTPVQEVEAPNRVEAIRAAQSIAAEQGGYVDSVELTRGVATTPFQADKYSYVPTASGIDKEVYQQTAPILGEGEEGYTSMAVPLFRPKEEANLQDIKAEREREAEIQRREEIERQRQEELARRREEEEARLNQQKFDEQKAEKEEKADIASTTSFLRGARPTIEDEWNVGEELGTRRLLAQQQLPDGTFLRSYEYENSLGMTERKYFIVNPDGILAKEDARQNEIEVNQSVWDQKKTIRDLELEDISDFVVEPGTEGGIDFGKLINFRGYGKPGGLNFERKILDEGGELIEDIIPKWFTDLMKANANAIVQMKDADGEYTGKITLFKGNLPVEDMIDDIPFYPDGYEPGTKMGEDVLDPFGPFDPLGEETFAEYLERTGQLVDEDGNLISEKQEDNFRKDLEKEEVIDTKESDDSGSFNELLENMGVSVGPFGVIADDMPGLPEGFFERTDWFVDKTTIERDVNVLFTQGEMEYQVSDAGIRIDSKGQPEYTEYVKIERVPNPEITSQLEAYALALEAKTSLQGSMASVLSEHIRATDGLGIGADAFNATEIANLRNNLALIGATEGLMQYGYDPEAETYRYNPETRSYDVIKGGFTQQVSEPMQQQRLQEIQYAQRPDISQQVIDIYSNPVAYGLLTSTEEGKKFLAGLEQQAQFDPFASEKKSDPMGAADPMGTSAETVIEPSSMGPLGGRTELNTLQANKTPSWNVPSAQDYTRMSEAEKGRELAGAAGAGYLGQAELEKAIAARTPRGFNIGYGVLDPWTMQKGTAADPWGGAVRAS
tara:strand:- start:79 stop:2451 length:2373 start_codon:yes stop_codon:yes gene_type:complete